MKFFRGCLGFFKHFRVGILDLGKHHQRNGDHRRDAQKGKANAVGGKQIIGTLDCGNEKQHHRPQKGTQLIQKFLIGKALACADLTGRKADQGIFRRFFDGLAHPLQDHKPAGNDPAVLRNQSQRRDRQHLQGIACNDQRPVFLCFIRKNTGQQTQRITTQLSHTGHKANGRAGCTCQIQVLTKNTPRTFMCHVRKQTDDAHQSNKGHSPSQALFLFQIHEDISPALP